MPTRRSHTVFRHLREVALLDACAEISDGQLLEDFVTRRDEAAFATLVRRHAPLVFGVCKRVIGHTQDAEDAFQATFLVLARKAATVLPREAVGNWLYGVAYRTARRARAVAVRRWAREKQVKNMPEPIVEPDPLPELEPIFDAELSRLPDKYRVPLVLCDLEGGSPKQVAKRLRLPDGTLASRLTRARQMLAQRLRRRGLALSGAVLATLVGRSSAQACAPRPLVLSTIKAATSVAAGSAATGLVSAKVAALTKGVLRTMLLTKLKIVTAVFVTLALLGGAGSFRILHGGDQTAVGQTPADKPGKQPVQRGEQVGPLVTWKERLALPPAPNKHQTFGVAVFGDGKRIAVAYGSGPKILDVTDGHELVSLGEGVGHGIAFSPDGKLVAHGNNLDVLVHSADSGEVRARLEGATTIAASLEFSPDGKTLATGGETVRLWDLSTYKELRQFKSGDVRSVAFSPDGKMLAAAEGSNNTVKVWEVATGKELATFTHNKDWAMAVAFSPDGKTLVSGSSRELKLWDLSKLKERATFKCPTGGGHSLAFSPDGKILASSSQWDPDDQDKHDNVVRLLDVATGKEIQSLTAHKEAKRDDGGVNVLWGLAFSRDGTLITAGDDAVRIWELEKNK